MNTNNEKEKVKELEKLPDIETYLLMAGFKHASSSYIGNGNKATVVYKNAETETTVQIIKNVDRESLLKGVISKAQAIGGVSS